MPRLTDNAYRYHARKNWIAENGPIPKGFVVHHIDEDVTNNDLSNLQLLSRSEHAKHHYYETALLSCGHGDWRKCKYCKEYDDTENMRKNCRGYVHRSCHIEYMNNWRMNNVCSW
jgi:hypothetical protein